MNQTLNFYISLTIVITGTSALLCKYCLQVFFFILSLSQTITNSFFFNTIFIFLKIEIIDPQSVFLYLL